MHVYAATLVLILSVGGPPRDIARGRPITGVCRDGVCLSGEPLLGQALGQVVVPVLVGTGTSVPRSGIFRIGVDDGLGRRSWGTGFALRYGPAVYVVTNFHVIAEKRGKIRLYGPDGYLTTAQTVGYDRQSDVAVLMPERKLISGFVLS